MLAATRHDGRAVPDDTGAATATEKTSTMAEATAMNGSGSAPADEAQKTAPPLAAVASSNGGDGGSSVAKKRKKDGLKPIITKEGATGTDEDEDDEDETGCVHFFSRSTSYLPTHLPTYLCGAVLLLYSIPFGSRGFVLYFAARRRRRPCGLASRWCPFLAQAPSPTTGVPALGCCLRRRGHYHLLQRPWFYSYSHRARLRFCPSALLANTHPCLAMKSSLGDPSFVRPYASQGRVVGRTRKAHQPLGPGQAPKRGCDDIMDRRLDMRLAERRDQDQTRRAVQAIGSVSGHHQPPCWLA